jgi:hypothetical protein
MACAWRSSASSRSTAAARLSLRAIGPSWAAAMVRMRLIGCSSGCGR